MTIANLQLSACSPLKEAVPLAPSAKFVCSLGPTAADGQIVVPCLAPGKYQLEAKYASGNVQVRELFASTILEFDENRINSTDKGRGTSMRFPASNLLYKFGRILVCLSDHLRILGENLTERK